MQRIKMRACPGAAVIAALVISACFAGTAFAGSGFGDSSSYSGVGDETVLIGVTGQETETGPGQASGTETGTETGRETGTGTDAGEIPDPNDSWQLILVNKDNPIPEDYVIPKLTELTGGNSVDSRIYPALQKMFDDARSQGIYPAITSSFRTMDKQQQLMDDKIAEYKASGYSDEEAVKQAEEWVAIPGTSEHQLGLSVDISSDETTGQDPGSVWYWMQLYSYQYGFIQRYPENKTDITGIINEPWHYRYVGIKAAEAMHESGQCLEEYLGVAE